MLVYTVILIVSTKVLYSENLQHGHVIEGELRVFNLLLNDLAVAVVTGRGFPVKTVAETLGGVSSSQLSERLKGTGKPRSTYSRVGDAAWLRFCLPTPFGLQVSTPFRSAPLHPLGQKLAASIASRNWDSTLRFDSFRFQYHTAAHQDLLHGTSIATLIFKICNPSAP
jgi:hypothetical protein